MYKPVVVALLLCIASFATRAEETPAQLAAQAKLGITQARVVALKAQPGKVVKEELEKEAGGSGLRYSFDIRSGKHVYEVGVDAKTGKVLEHSRDDGAND